MGSSDKCVVIKKVIIVFFKKKRELRYECLSLCNYLIYSEYKSPVQRLVKVYTYTSVNCTLLPYKSVHSCCTKVYTLVKRIQKVKNRINDINKLRIRRMNIKKHGHYICFR